MVLAVIASILHATFGTTAGSKSIVPARTLLGDMVVSWLHRSSSRFSTTVCSIQQQDPHKCQEWRADSVGYIKQDGRREIRCASTDPVSLCCPHLASERRTKDHTRAINKLSVSHVVHYYCITGSADGDMRIWVRTNIPESFDHFSYCSIGSPRPHEISDASAIP